MKFRILILVMMSALGGWNLSSAAVTVTVKNRLNQPRAAETVVVKWSDISDGLGKVRADRVVVQDAEGKNIVAQPIFYHGQKKGADELVFQADFSANEEKEFTIQEGMPEAYEPTVFCRWVPERNDDFAWENGRIAYRIYGPLLEQVEPASSGVDVWPKRTRNLIIDKWYQLAQSINEGYYHSDHGEGLDCYKVGHGQGCGGTAIWANGKRYTTGIKGWKTQRVIANGPIRLIFELTYDPIDVDGIAVSETKRVTLDAQQNLNHYQCTFTADKPDPDLTIAVGVMKHTDRPGVEQLHKEEGWMSYWDAGDSSPLSKDNGHVGCSAVVDPKNLKDMIDAEDHLLALMPAQSGVPIDFWAGAGWDRSGDFRAAENWHSYNSEWAMRIRSPLVVSVSGK